MKITLNRQTLLGIISVTVFSLAVYQNFLKDSKFFKTEKKKINKKINKTIKDKNETNSTNTVKIKKGMILFLKYKCKNENNSNYCNELAKIYLQQDKKNKAEKIFERSCNLGDAQGCFYNVALKTEKNEKSFEKINEIINDLQFSCDKNFTKSCNILANLNLKYFNNKQKAIQLLQKSCKLKDDFACSKLQELEKN